MTNSLHSHAGKRGSARAPVLQRLEPARPPIDRKIRRAPWLRHLLPPSAANFSGAEDLRSGAWKGSCQLKLLLGPRRLMLILQPTSQGRPTFVVDGAWGVQRCRDS